MSCPHTHQQNGVAERKHRHIVETGLALLAHASVPFRFWSDAFSTACFLINRLPTRLRQMKTPLELLLNEVPDYTFLKVFGCACWPHLRPYNQRKLEFRSKQCVFLGYSSLHKGYKCLHVPSNRVYISRDVVFNENVFPFYALQSPPPVPLHLRNLFYLCLVNLLMLHIPPCCYLTMVQVLGAEHASSFWMSSRPRPLGRPPSPLVTPSVTWLPDGVGRVGPCYLGPAWGWPHAGRAGRVGRPSFARAGVPARVG